MRISENVYSINPKLKSFTLGVGQSFVPTAIKEDTEDGSLPRQLHFCGVTEDHTGLMTFLFMIQYENMSDSDCDGIMCVPITIQILITNTSRFYPITIVVGSEDTQIRLLVKTKDHQSITVKAPKL